MPNNEDKLSVLLHESIYLKLPNKQYLTSGSPIISQSSLQYAINHRPQAQKMYIFMIIATEYPFKKEFRKNITPIQRKFTTILFSLNRH